MRSLIYACIALFASANTLALALFHRDYNETLPTRVIHQFPNETWLENLAIRQNGQILVTVLSAPELYLIDPLHTDSNPTLIHRFPEAVGLLGIVELQQDVFYVIAGNWSVETFQTTPGSYCVWKVDLSSGDVLDGSSSAIASKVTNIPEGVFLNGMAVLNRSESLVVIGDAGAGVVFTLNVETGMYSKTIDDPTMKPVSINLGINGIKIREGYLYYLTTEQKLFSRIPVNTTDGTPAGPVEVIATNFFGDDFSFDEMGNAFVGQNIQNTVATIAPNGAVTVVAGNLNSTLVAGPTSTAFGRTPRDLPMLYVTTTGGFGSSVKLEGGKVVALYT
jgi:hypothetical protein